MAADGFLEEAAEELTRVTRLRRPCAHSMRAAQCVGRQRATDQRLVRLLLQQVAAGRYQQESSEPLVVRGPLHVEVLPAQEGVLGAAGVVLDGVLGPAAKEARALRLEPAPSGPAIEASTDNTCKYTGRNIMSKSI